MLLISLEIISVILKTFLIIFSHIPNSNRTQQIINPQTCDTTGSVKYRHERRTPFIQRSVAEPSTSILTPIITRMIFEWAFGYHMLFLLLHDMLQNLRWDISVSPWYQHMLPIPVFLLIGFVFFSCSRVPASSWLIHAVSGQAWMDAINQECTEYLSIVRGENSSLELSSLSSYVSMNT